MEATATIAAGGRDARILTLIGAGHFLSHFYFLTLPPLFPLLTESFNVGYTELGLLMTALYAASGIAQVPVGFLVDRIGARLVLSGGLVLMAVGFGLIGIAPSYWMMVAFGVIAGIGHSVFHPADYAILNGSISPGRMGRAFSIHTFAGHLGSAMAPATMIFLAALAGWRAAMVLVGVAGLVIMAALSTQWSALQDDAHPKGTTRSAGAASPGRSSIGLLFSAPMMLFFLFFAMISMTSTGMQAFSVAALVTLHDMPAATAGAGLTVFLFCSAAGVLLGGHVADRTARHDLVAAAVFVMTVIFTLLLASIDLSFALLIVLMTAMGLGLGMVRPARDMMLRAAAPKGSAGTVFGFVSAGIATGSAVAPIPFGMLLDAGRPEWVFYLIAIFMVVALGAVMVPKRQAT